MIIYRLLKRCFYLWLKSLSLFEQHIQMKTHFITLIIFVCWISSSAQQAKFVSQPDSICGKDALVWNAPGHNNGNTNYGGDDFMGAHAWTNQGVPDTSRSLLQFDLSSIPQGSIVTYAYLSLFNNPTTPFAGGQHSTFSGPNDLYIQRITSQWSEMSVNWFSQPSATTVNQATVPASTSPHEDFLNIDVTMLVQDMVDNPLNSFGFMIRLQNEAYYRSMVFATSDYNVSAKRPMLFVHYILPSSGCFIIQPHQGCGTDATVWNAPGCYNGTTNYGLDDFLGAHAWTNQGTPDTSRSLLKFDLNAIPPNAVITSALLSLYNNPNTVFAGGEHSWLSGPNNGLIQRITSNWDDRTVTWMTQPSSTTQNQVPIPTSVNIHQDYPNIDVTSLVVDMINDPTHSYGFMIRLDSEAFYRALVFASSNEADESKNPKLEICFSIPDNVENISQLTYHVYPNPAQHTVSIEAKEYSADGYNVSMKNILGEEVFRKRFHSGNMLIPVDQCSEGIYILRIESAEGVYTEKLMVNR
jgi:hypothetical protein